MGALLFLYPMIVMALIKSPVAGEYWVNEMITVKKDLVKPYEGKKKIILVGGSSTLFAIDAARATHELGVPVINLALHAAMKLSRLLAEADAVVEKNDAIVLVLEPAYYECGAKFSAWQVRNAIAWDHELWPSLNVQDKASFVFSVSPTLLVDMAVAKTQSAFFPKAVAIRKEALDVNAVLTKFHQQGKSNSFEYSTQNLDDFGSLRGAVGVRYQGKDSDDRKPRHACQAVLSQLQQFKQRMTERGVSVYVARTPYRTVESNPDGLQQAEAEFVSDLSTVGCVMDRREDLLMPHQYFFDTALHLNKDGQKIRTDLFIHDWQQVQASKHCYQ